MQNGHEYAVKFLIQCYFGTIEDPLLTAIDRAYRDMLGIMIE